MNATARISRISTRRLMRSLGNSAGCSPMSRKMIDPYTSYITITNTPYITITNTPYITITNTPYITITNTPYITITNTPYITITNTLSHHSHFSLSILENSS
jgi:hypothetical protein